MDDIAGVDRGTVMRSYVLTNEYSTQRLTPSSCGERIIRPEAGVAMRASWSVSLEFPKAVAREIDVVFGSFDTYLKSGRGSTIPTWRCCERNRRGRGVKMGHQQGCHRPLPERILGVGSGWPIESFD